MDSNFKNKFKESKDEDLKGVVSYNGFININRDLAQQLFLKDSTLRDTNIYAHRILANIIATTKKFQHHPKNESYGVQLKFFEDEFMTIDNTSMVFRMSIKEISHNANYKNLEKALETLEKFQYGWHTSFTEDGRKIRSSGGLIKEVQIEKTNGFFRFEVTSYWLKKILFLGDYNKTLYELSNKISSTKKLIFWHWLTIIPEKGTQIKFTKLNDMLDLKYKSAGLLAKHFLKKARDLFTEHSHESFNFHCRGDIIHIIRYHLKPSTKEDNIKEVKERKERRLRTYKLRYIKKRHELYKEEDFKRVETFLSLDFNAFLEAYEDFKKDINDKKGKSGINMTSFKGKAFLTVMQSHLIYLYRNTVTGKHYPNGYPKI